MTTTGLQQMELKIARCRIILSLVATVAIYVDPVQPLLAHWFPLVSGPFVIDAHLALLMALHLGYSIAIYVGLDRSWTSPQQLAGRTVWADVAFAAAIATLTEGVSSPSYPFFAFAILEVALRAGLRQTMLVTGTSVLLYLCLILLSSRGLAELYLMRPVYLAITGYLVGYLGQRRLDLQEEMRQLAVRAQRHRIARDLHDSFAQALAGINLRLESCRRLLHASAPAEALDDLTELQESVKNEFDELRSYTRSLAGLEITPAAMSGSGETQLSLRAEVSGSLDLVDHVLWIAHEAITNVRRHARATAARILIHSERNQVRIYIHDDGVGIQGETPWSIASRVKEIGGQMETVADAQPGTHLMITLPQG